jgi:hypothetical protein
MREIFTAMPQIRIVRNAGNYWSVAPGTTFWRII